MNWSDFWRKLELVWCLELVLDPSPFDNDGGVDEFERIFESGVGVRKEEEEEDGLFDCDLKESHSVSSPAIDGGAGGVLN